MSGHRLRATIDVEIDVTDDELALLLTNADGDEALIDAHNDLLDRLADRALEEVRGQYINWEVSR